MSGRYHSLLFFLVFSGATAGVLRANDEFPTVVNSEQDRTATPMSAEQAAKEIALPPGFHATLVAAEPDVQNPIAMSWDSRGRLWVAENYTYAQSNQRFDLSMRDRVLVFADTDHDGTLDQRTVFTDQVQMLTSVEVGMGGVWLMCPPQVLFIPDANQDLKPDGPATVVLDGFTVAQANYHNFANGLRFGPDGWLYGRCGGSCPGRIGVPGVEESERIALEGGIWRYHPERKQVEVLCAGTTNPWGHDWNENGELFFINTVNGHFWHAIAGAHYRRPFNLDPNPETFDTIDHHADHYHFDTGKSWTDSRNGAANDLGGGHAHCGAMFYLNDQWPETYRGKFFTCNLHGRRINQETVTRKDSGYTASHDRDLAIMADPFFRGMELSVGPDGSVYVLDWSDTGECHEHTGVHRTSGRIFKLSYGDQDASHPDVAMDRLNNLELVALHRSRNEWAVRQARLVLHQRVAQSKRMDDDLRAALERLSVDSSEDGSPSTRIRAAMTLFACNQVDHELWSRWLASREEAMRVWALRWATDAMPIDDVFGPKHTVQQVDDELYDLLLELAKHDSSSLVRLTLASTLQRLPITKRAGLAALLMQHADDQKDHNLPLLVWYGLMPVAKADPSSLVTVAMESRWPQVQRFIARRLTEQMQSQPGPVDELVAEAAQASPRIRLNVLSGMNDAMQGWARAQAPASWPKLVSAMKSDESEANQIAQELGVIFGDGRAMTTVRAIVLDEKAEIGVRRSALTAFIQQRPDDLVDVCSKLLGDQRLSALAVSGLVLEGNAKNAELIMKNYRRYRGTDRPAIIASMVTRKDYAQAVLDAISKGVVAKAELAAYDARQIQSLGDAALNQRLAEVWGEMRESPAEKKKQMEQLKALVSDSTQDKPDLSQGRVVYQQLCAKCHRLYGQGENIGPDLTGSNRSNLDYLVENIVDPSAIVQSNYRVSVVAMDDGRVLSGVIVTQNERTVSLQTQTERLVLDREQIEAINQTAQSPMPEGQMETLTQAQIRNLFAYLMHPSQVALPSNTSAAATEAR